MSFKHLKDNDEFAKFSITYLVELLSKILPQHEINGYLDGNLIKMYFNKETTINYLFLDRTTGIYRIKLGSDKKEIVFDTMLQSLMYIKMRNKQGLV